MLPLYLLIQQYAQQHDQGQGKCQAFLSNHQGKLPPCPPNRGIDNRPAWAFCSRDDKKVKDVTLLTLLPTDNERRIIYGHTLLTFLLVIHRALR